MSDQNSMTAEQSALLSALVTKLKAAAKDAGSMSALWDDIHDIEAFISGRRTILTKTASEWIATAQKHLNERTV